MTTEQLQAFCSTDPTRPEVGKPFTRAGFTWATDGRVLVRVATIEGLDDGDLPWPVITPEGLMAEHQPGPKWYALPALPERQPDKPCPACGGKKAEKCLACDGEGTVEFAFDYGGTSYSMEGNCPVCDGEGACRHCDGTGLEPRKAQPVAVGPAWFNADVLRPFALLAHCELAPVDAYKPCRVRFDGGEGLAMPMRMPEGAR